MSSQASPEDAGSNEPGTLNRGVLLVRTSGPVAELSLNRPKTKNALNRELLSTLTLALGEADASPAIRAIVLGGEGGAFCSGADLSELVDPSVDLAARLSEFQAVIRIIARSDKPVIAAVDGPAVGFGADLALACDLRVLSSRAYVQEKFVALGLMPDGGGTFSMPELVGAGRALEFLMLGTKLDAEQALALGIANRVVDTAALGAETRALALELAQAPPLALAAIKRAVRSKPATLEDALDRERESQLGLLRSEDLREGVRAWMEKRPPRFSGH